MESGLYQNWMRDYDPTTGRYIQADPLGLVDGASVYGYARQNPGRYVDPRGEYLFLALPFLGGGAATGGGISLGTGAIIGGGLLLSTVPNATANGENAQTGTLTETGEMCVGDKCAVIYAEIERFINILRDRHNDYQDDPLGLPEVGPYPPGDRRGHRKAFREAQQGLRNRLNNANIVGCLGYNREAWYWASRPIY